MSSFQKPQEEYVAISLDTPDRRTIQALLQLSQQPTISDFSISNSHGPSSFQSNNQINFQKRNFFPNPQPKHKNKNRNFRHPNPSFGNQRNSPYPSRSPHKIPHFNNHFSQPKIQPNIQADNALGKLDLSHPFVSLILLAALKQSQNTTNNMNTNQNMGNENPKFEYSSHFNNNNNNQKFSASKSPRSHSPMGKFPRFNNNQQYSGPKRVHWADEQPQRGSHWQAGYSSASKSKRNNSRSNSRSSSYDSQRSFSNRSNRNYQNNGWNGGNKTVKGILKNNQRFNQSKSPSRMSPFQKASVSKLQYKGSVPKLDSKGSIPKINLTNLIGKRSAPPLTGSEGHWECPYPRCRAVNISSITQCTNCGITKPKVVNRNGPAFKKGDWNCPSCSNLNFARRSDCNICQTERPAETYENFRPRKIVKIQVAAEEKIEETEAPRDDIKWNVLEEGELDEALDL